MTGQQGVNDRSKIVNNISEDSCWNLSANSRKS